MSALCDPLNKTFLITGAASGLGALYAEWFLKEGAKSIAILDVAVEKGQELAAKLNPDKVFFFKCDVSDETELTKVFNQVITKFGQLDVIINNAGIMVDSPSTWRRACDVNWQGLVSLTLKGVNHMRKDEGGAGGTIINVASTMAIVKMSCLPIYSGSKAAVLHFTQSMAMDPFHEQTGVRLLIFSLGATQTDLLADLENKGWDMKTGELCVQAAAASVIQKPQSAADAVVKIFKGGANGSIWLATHDRPAKDITQIVDATFKSYEPLLE